MGKYDHLEIDDALHKGLPKLTKDEYERLKANVVQDGVIHDPVVIWGHVVVDGRHRVQISRETGIEFTVAHKNFTDNDEARDWIINRALGKRNLSLEQRTMLLGELFINRKKTSELAQVKAGKGVTVLDKMSKTEIAETIAAEHHVDEKTVRRAAKYVEATEQLVAPVRQAVVNREVKATAAQVHQLASMPAAEQKAAIAAVKKGEVKKLAEALPKPKPKANKKHLKFNDEPLLKHFKELIQLMDKRKAVYPDCKDTEPLHTAVVHNLRAARDNFDRWRKMTA